MYNILVIGIGGFFGAISRFIISKQMALLLGDDFPYGTLLVNAVGSFLLGFLSRYLMEHFVVSELVRVSLLIGFLGAFTTFSTFSYESIMLLQEGDFIKAGVNILSNILLCLILCFVGFQFAKSL
ncbi:MAG: fluoride efflux transporter CrcB [Deltaproteobacteria bacterium]|nr:fluoride efflux transporter CrcB [Deltaproteobacteria bacterium]MBT4266119.1 fluoride efflux transporter CrcB [Deltaproteobacteria bacterium]MBT4642883.1 fluoride efflux transporter CrcB [Deltaproteobacteria bacterium]MBT6504422.1 fluoride efflux transporter CrcB [Deltaproteobacteria bacterium]MBT6615468.1 fluoride efflux transporter CrcB [Deltaproteobacteria bacterium]